MFILIGIAVFALQVVAYKVIARKLAARAAYRSRLAGIRTTVHAPRVPLARNRLGDN